MAASDSFLPKSKDGSSVGQKTGRLIIVSAPSGAGKTTLCNAIRQHFNGFAYSVSYTTRPSRQSEKDGRDYHFIDIDEFEQGIAQNRWAEWAKVHGNYYGTSAQWIDSKLKTGKHILMDIDLQGVRQMLPRFPEAVTIFIMPPSIKELKRRLNGRGTDDPRSVALRLANAKEEIAQKDICRHVLVNDNLEATTRDLMALIQGYIGVSV